MAGLFRRAADPSERELLRQIHHSAYRDLIEREFGEWDEGRARRYFDQKWEAGGVEVIMRGDQIAGFCVVKSTPGSIEVNELVVAPEHQNCGIGSWLLEATMAWAEAGGVTVILRTSKSNRAAALYRRLGFVETGHDETHLHFEWRPRSVTARR